VAEMASVTPLTPARSSEPSSASSAAPDPVRQATRSLRRFAILMGELDEFSRAQALDEMADTLVANRQADGVLYLMEELSRLISARLKRR
jgi:hypothetical protein